MNKSLLICVAALALCAGVANATYTRIANSGVDLHKLPPVVVGDRNPKVFPLGSGASDWACTRDNATGLTWEVKTDDGGLRDKDNVYTNYDSLYGSSEQINSATNSIGFANAVNKVGLCGFNDWRRPSEEELSGLVINEYFPNSISSVTTYFWSGSPYYDIDDRNDDSIYALYWPSSQQSQNALNLRMNTYSVRLVRGGQSFDSLPLSVLAMGSGTGSVNVGGTACAYNGNPTGIPCTAYWGNGSAITLTATPGAGSAFTGWSGACTGTSTTCNLSLTAAQSVSATFTRIASTSSLVAHPTTPGLLFVGLDGSGVYKSTNDGANWAACAAQPDSLSIRSLLISGTTLYAGTTAGVFKSTDGCASWTAMNAGLPN